MSTVCEASVDTLAPCYELTHEKLVASKYVNVVRGSEGTYLIAVAGGDHHHLVFHECVEPDEVVEVLYRLIGE